MKSRNSDILNRTTDSNAPAMLATPEGATWKVVAPMRYQYILPPSAANQWRSVRGYEGIYEVSSLGHVRRVTTYRNGRAGMIMSVRVHPVTGYPQISLSRANKCRTYTLHKIVAEAFLGPRPDGMEINHIDRDKLNPSASNLEYVTPVANTQHAYETGHVAARGSSKPIAKLTDDDARAIFSSDESGRTLAARYGVSPQTICDIKHARAWRHATSEVQ